MFNNWGWVDPFDAQNAEWGVNPLDIKVYHSRFPFLRGEVVKAIATGETGEVIVGGYDCTTIMIDGVGLQTFPNTELDRLSEPLTVNPRYRVGDRVIVSQEGRVCCAIVSAVHVTFADDGIDVEFDLMATAPGICSSWNHSELTPAPDPLCRGDGSGLPLDKPPQINLRWEWDGGDRRWVWQNPRRRGFCDLDQTSTR